MTSLDAIRGTIFAIDQTAVHDGPGIRMVVYLKGCPLRCVWCHSPESQRPEPEVVWYEMRCARCGACVRAGAATEPGAGHYPACPAEATEIKGEEVAAGAVVAQAVRQRAFFRVSGGGVTLSGGEPTLQPEFAHALLALLRAEGIHTALETTGACAWSVLAALAPVTSLFLYDLKHADPEEHLRDTGFALGPILDNLERLLATGAEVLVRTPCIPGRNDTPAAISAIARTARARGARRISLLPYNPATPGKYAWLRREYALGVLRPQSPEALRLLEEAARREGLEVVPPAASTPHGPEQESTP